MATGTTEFVDNTTADVFIPEIWSMEAIVARPQRIIFSKLVNHDFEKELMKFGDTVNIPSRAHLAARTKTLNSNAAITFETQTETNTQLIVNQWEYAAMAVEDIIDVQANRDLFAFYAAELGYALDLSVDAVLAGLPDDFGTNVVGVLGSDLTYPDLLTARQQLDDANAPDDDRFIVISPKQEAGFLQLDNFINRDYTDKNGVAAGGANDPNKGWIGTWMGTPVYKTTHVEGTNAAGHDNTMFHRSALAVVLQMKPKTVHQYDINFLTDKVAMEQVYGTKEIRDDHGVWMKGS